MKAILILPAILGAAAVAAAQDVPRFGVVEKSFTQSGSYASPHAAVSATATLSRPGGGTRTIPLFWDGGGAWRFRFSPDATGTWSWSTSSSDAGLNGKSGTFNCVSSSGKGGIRKRASHPYHFEHETGVPFWWFGDTQWRLYASDAAENLSRSAVLHYIDVRAAQGFNVVHADLFSRPNEGGAPFTDYAAEKINPAFWQEVDARVDYLNSKGVTGGLMLAWANGSPSWASFSSDAARKRYARYVVARYAARNVYFIVSGEWNETGTKAMYQAIGNEIAAADPHDRLIAIHATGAVEEFAAESWMSFGDYQQIYSNLHGAILVARDHNKPVVNSEYAYFLRDQNGDGVVDKPNSATLTEIRNASWDIVMAGGYLITGFGTTYFGGNRDPGPFNVDASKNDPWEEDVQWVKKAFAGLEWWKLQPSDGLLGGSGTRYCLAETGQQYLAYVRGNSGTNALSLGGAASASYSVQRYDPRSGAYTALSNYTGTGPVTLDPPDGQDWIFVLKRTSSSTNQPPSVSISASTTSVAPNQAVTFSAAASDPDGTIASHQWNWGNATENGSGAPPASKTHAWSAAGSYAVKLTATDNGGLSTTSNTITITVSTNQPPSITSAGATPNSGTAPLAVSFSAAATDPEGQALTYQWDFQGDGSYDATGSSASFTYTAAGHYDPVLRVSDGTNAVTRQLTVDVDSGGTGSTLDVPAEADTYIYATNPATNYGTAGDLNVGGGTTQRVIYIRFNVQGLPTGASVTDARIRFTASNSSTEGGGTIRKFNPTSATWSETQPTWNSPLAGADGSGDLASLGPVSSGAVVEFPNLQGAVTGNGRVTFVIRSTFQDAAGYRSKDYGTASQRPVLRLTYGSGGGSGGGFSVSIDAVSTGRPYSLSTAQAGALYFIDRSYTIGSLGAGLNGGVLIRTANDDKNVAASSHLAFTLSGGATVFVGYDKRATTAPSWLNDGTWTLTADVLTASDGAASPLRVYRKAVAAGQVVLGGNKAGGGDGAGSHYVVIVQPTTAAKSFTTSLAAGPLAADVWEHDNDADGDGLEDAFERAQGVDPAAPDTDGDGAPDEHQLLASGKSLWELQAEEAAPAGGGDGGGGGGACGATGLELLAVFLLAAFVGRRKSP